MTDVVRIFLSGTNGDLEHEKNIVLATLNGSQHYKCVAPGLQGPIDATAIEGCKDQLFGCQIYLGLIGRRRGYETMADKRLRSITEIEYNYAGQLGIPRLIWMPLDDYLRPVPEHECDAKTARQNDFRDLVQKERIFGSRAKSADALATEAVLAVSDTVIAQERLKSFRPSLIANSELHGDDTASTTTKHMAELLEALRLCGLNDAYDVFADNRQFDAKIVADVIKPMAEQFATTASGNVEQEKLAAKLYRGVGLLTALDSEQDAIAPLQKSVGLFSDDPEAWNDLGTLLDKTGNSSDAAKAFQLVQVKAQFNGQRAWQAVGAMNYGLAMLDADLETAEGFIRLAQQLETDLGNRRGMLNCMGNLALVQVRRGDLPGARKTREACLASEQADGTSQGEAAEYAGLGAICIKLDDLAAARDYIVKGLYLDRVLGDKIGEAGNLIQLGILERKENQPARSLITFALAITILTPRGIRDSLAKALYNKGRSHQKLQQWPDARDCIQKAFYFELDLQLDHDATRTGARIIDCIARAGANDELERAIVDTLAAFTEQAFPETCHVLFARRLDVVASKLAADNMRDAARIIWGRALDLVVPPDAAGTATLIKARLGAL